MADDNQELKAANETIEALRKEIDSFKTKDLDSQLASVRAELAVKTKEVESLTTQVATITEASKSLAKRAEDAEQALETAEAALTEIASKTLKASRIDMAVKKGADAKAAETLVENLASLSDEAFAATLEVVAASFKSSTPPPSDTPAPPKSSIARIDEAVVEDDASLAVSSEVEKATAAETRRNLLGEFLSKNILSK